VLCGIPWAVLFIHRLAEHRTSPVPFGRFLLHHLILGCVFVLLSGLWVLIFYMRGDEALWHEWFWVNHVGRLTGEAVEKGHIIRGKPLYYVFQLLGYAVPWSPLVFFWFGEAAVRAVRERRVSRERLFLFGWGGLSLVVLSVSATKRGIYLTPVLPVFAVTAALAMGEESPRWFRPWGIFWVVLAMGLVLIVAFCPFFTGILPGKIPPKILESLSRFGGYNVLSLFGFAICPYLIHKFRLKLTDARALVLVTAVLYISLFGYPARAIDAEKNMGPDIREFVSKIPEDRWKKIAATELTESMTGCLYFYGGMDVHLVWDKQRLDDIVAGRDPEYDSLIIKRKTRRLDDDQNLVPVPYTVLAKRITDTDTALFWIQGAPPQ
jgi:4-amino-4-deoxy-L-arabinose transferase-like glycosyltransferase